MGGTAARARQLGRGDLAGKTGTTNDQLDAWFAGFNPKLVAVAWIGFDTPRSLGGGETGGAAALPIWMSYMAVALQGMPDEPLVPPEGVVAASINPETGLRNERSANRVPEFFLQENIPGEEEGGGADGSRKPRTDDVDDQLY